MKTRSQIIDEQIINAYLLHRDTLPLILKNHSSGQVSAGSVVRSLR